MDPKEAGLVFFQAEIALTLILKNILPLFHECLFISNFCSLKHSQLILCATS